MTKGEPYLQIISSNKKLRVSVLLLVYKGRASIHLDIAHTQIQTIV